MLDLTPSWTKNNHKRNSQKLVSIDLEEIRQQKRDTWLNLQQENPELSKTELRKLVPDVYAWLYRRDRTWLNNHSPKLQKPKVSVDRVDWNIRDEEILAQAKSIVEQLLHKDKPVRITIGRIGSSIGLKALLEKHLDKLPRTKEYLESVVETIEDFQIRRIEWAIAELNSRGEEIKEWKVLRLAGLRSNLSYQVAQYLVQHC